METKLRKQTKRELQQQLKAIVEQEHKEMIEKYYPEFKKYEGRFFKVRNNYSRPEKPSDYWWLYKKVVEIKPNNIYDTGSNGVACHYSGWSFETDSYGTFTVSQRNMGYLHSLGEEITEAEFNAAWNKAMDRLDNLI